jgi:outer membrane protein assembly factor BamE (lipoprotein component of BamABCDE complex)
MKIKAFDLRLTGLATLLATSALLGLSACAPVASHRGYIAFEADPAKDVKVGDSQSSVQEKLGSPSQTASFDPNVWYYIDQMSERMTYKASKTVASKVVVIEFDKTSHVVTKVTSLGLADTRTIAPNSRITPTRGRSMTALEQVLGTVGRQTLPEDQENPGGQRRRE